MLSKIGNLFGNLFYIYTWYNFVVGIFLDDDKLGMHYFNNYAQFTHIAKERYGLTHFENFGPFHQNSFRVRRWIIVKCIAYFVLTTVSLILFVKSKLIRRFLSFALALFSILSLSLSLCETFDKYVTHSDRLFLGNAVFVEHGSLVLAAGLGFLLYC